MYVFTFCLYARKQVTLAEPKNKPICMEQALTRLLSAISIYERLRPQNSELPLKKKILVLQCSKLYFYFFPVLNLLGTAVRSWLRHCATSQKVAGSIPDGVIGIFHWHNPSGRNMALGSTQPLTEMSTGNISWG